jgi:hypothetical protein
MYGQAKNTPAKSAQNSQAKDEMLLPRCINCCSTEIGVRLEYNSTKPQALCCVASMHM